MKIDCLVGSAAVSLINNSQFREEWTRLFELCPWATIYQSVDLVTTWYFTYYDNYSPVLVSGTNSEGALTGLLTLALSVETGELVIAGTHHAEYQTWICAPPEGDTFIKAALHELRETFPSQKLQFYFLAPQSPLEWNQGSSFWRSRSILRSFSRGLMTIDNGSSFEQRLRKNRKFVNRLKRLGNLRLDRIEDPRELDAIFDELLDYTIFREKAVYGVNYQSDFLKKPYHVNLMRTPGLFYATVLRVDEKIVSARLDVNDRGHVSGGMLTHSPLYSRASPGSTHFLMLGAELGRKGIHLFDLTPGSEYKERFATHHDEAYKLTVYFNRFDCFRYKLKRKLIETTKLALQSCKLPPAKLHKISSDLKQWRERFAQVHSPAALFRWLGRSLWSTEELRIFACNVNTMNELPAFRDMSKDRVGDLLTYHPVEPWQMRERHFLKRAQDLMESDGHFYTFVEKGQLTHCGWLIEQPHPPFTDELGVELGLSPEMMILTDFFVHPHSRSSERCFSALAQMLQDASQIPDISRVYLCVASDNQPWREAIERIGATYQYSVFKKRMLWRKYLRSTAPQQKVTNLSLEVDAMGGS